MKKWRSWLSLIMALILVLNFSLSGAIQVFAHSAILDVDYDDCDIEENGDGIDELWYALGESGIYGHLSHEETTIKYYFSNLSQDGFYTWTSNGVSADLAQEIKNAYADSMRKWNNVYFYTYNSDGTVIKNKLINIVPGTENDYNLIIYPTRNSIAFASTGMAGNAENIVDKNGTTHCHYSQWTMTVDVGDFYVNGSGTADEVEIIRERTGAHEMGHILGLLDVKIYVMQHQPVGIIMSYLWDMASR